jgi:hypothetical protein
MGRMLIGDNRLRTLIQIEPARIYAVLAGARERIADDHAAVIGSGKPLIGAPRMCQPDIVTGDIIRRRRRVDRRPDFKRLLVERPRLLVGMTEAVGPDGAIVTLSGNLDVVDPPQRLDPARGDVGTLQPHARAQHGLGQTAIIIGEHRFEPAPVRPRRDLVKRDQPVGAAAQYPARQIMFGMRREQEVGAKHRKGDRTRGQEIQCGRGGALEQFMRPLPNTGIARIARRRAECPEGSPAAILRPDLLEPVASEAHEIAKFAAVRVPGMLHERRKD